MNFIKKIKFLFKIRRPIKNIGGIIMQKPGWKTSEFYLTVLSNLIAIAGALNGVLDPKTAAIIMAVLNGLYTTLRTVAKTGETTAPTEPPK
jgi:hypothetical protein